MSTIINISDLVVSYRMDGGDVFALDGVDFTITRGERIGIVGESGSGKSTLGMAIGRLLAPNARFLRGDIRLVGQSILSCSATELRQIRRDSLGFVYQNPMSALDPTMRVGRQVAVDRAALQQHRAAPRAARMAVQAKPDRWQPFVGVVAEERAADRDVLVARQAAAGGEQGHGIASQNAHTHISAYAATATQAARLRVISFPSLGMGWLLRFPKQKRTRTPLPTPRPCGGR